MPTDAYTDAYSDAYGGDSTTAPLGVYPDVYPWIAQCLQDSAKDVDDEYFDLSIVGTLDDLIPDAVLARSGFVDGVELYASLTGKDRRNLSRAVAYMVSADFQPGLATGGAGGDLLSEQTEQVKRSFGSAAELRAYWRSEAARLLGACSFSPPSGLKGRSLFAANGPSRVRDERRGRCYDE